MSDQPSPADDNLNHEVADREQEADWQDHWEDDPADDPDNDSAGDWEEDNWEETGERLYRKKTKPTGRRKVADLVTTQDAEGKDQEIADATVRHLAEQGYIREVIAELKSGKEATTYIVETDLSGEQSSALLKIYRDFEARSFKNDAVYREGQITEDSRAARAMKSRSRKGLSMLQFEWVIAEYTYLWTLWRAGLNVPQPLVGPDIKDYADTVPAVLMGLIGTEDSPAPRLSDAQLTPTEAQSACDQSIQGLSDLLRLGYVHGDYSTYNLLWWEGAVYIIDFPQMSTRKNPNFEALLRRDAQSLSTNFKRFDIDMTAEQILQEAQRRLKGPAPTPRTV